MHTHSKVLGNSWRLSVMFVTAARQCRTGPEKGYIGQKRVDPLLLTSGRRASRTRPFSIIFFLQTKPALTHSIYFCRVGAPWSHRRAPPPEAPYPSLQLVGLSLPAVSCSSFFFKKSTIQLLFISENNQLVQARWRGGGAIKPAQPHAVVVRDV